MMVVMTSIIIVTVILGIVNKLKINWYHLIWALLPIDMYGLHVLNFTLKPYYFWCIPIFFYLIINRKFNSINNPFKSKVMVLSCIIFMMMIVADLFNGSGISSIMQQFMWLLTLLIAILYTSLIKDLDDWFDAYRMIYITTCVYIVGFIVLYFVSTIFNINGVVAFDKWEPGLFIKFSNSQLIRLRGFYIDANVFFTSLSIGVSGIIINGMITKFRIRNILWMFGAIFVGYLTNSRNTLVIVLFFVIASFIFKIRQQKTSSEKIKTILFIFIISIFIVIIMIYFNFGIKISEWYSRNYSEHSELNAQYGRLAIWINNWSIIKDKLLFGLGQGMMQTVSYRDFHNTWLEMIGANGIFAGVMYLGLIIIVLINYISYKKYINNLNPKYIKLYYTFLLGFIGIIISLTTVSNINNSFLLFSVFTMATGIDILKDSKIQKNM